jgi:hypothetical protein
MKMTAYENFQYDESGSVLVVSPAHPYEVVAQQIFEFLGTLSQEMERYDISYRGEVDDNYSDGYYDAAEQLYTRFKEIFNVEVK